MVFTPELPAARGLTARYVLALSLVASLSLIAFISLRATITTQETTAAIVNFSGKRRFTSQRAALYALRLATADNDVERTVARREMLNSIAVMERAHRGLLDGDPTLHLPGQPSPAIAAKYFFGVRPVDPMVREYLRRIRALADLPAEQLRSDLPDLAWILQVAPNDLLEALDDLVAAYQSESEHAIRRLQRLETGVFMLTLLVLALEARFIFRPMVAQVRRESTKLQQALGYTRSIVDNSYDAIVTIGADGAVASANPAAERLFGRRESDLMLARFSALVDDTSLSGVHSVVIPRPDHSVVTADAAYTSMQVAAGRVVIATLRESTEQLKHHAAELERRNLELDQFAYAASHDLKAPLRSIASLTEWLEEDVAGKLSAESTRHLALVRNRVRRMHALIEGIHQYATATRPSAPDERVDVRALVQDIVDEHNHGVRFSVTIGVLPTLITDRTRLWQVFANLIANAIKHHHRPSGNLAVAAEPVLRDGTTAWWRFSVSDDGPGIAPEHHAKIFVIFQTLSERSAERAAGSNEAGLGLGLGLALVRKIVGDHGGVVEVRSAPGAGATFTFTWPAHLAENT